MKQNNSMLNNFNTALICLLLILFNNKTLAQVDYPYIGSPIPGIILDTQLLSFDGDAGVIQTGGLVDGVEGFADRLGVGYTWNTIPDQMVGADFIQTAQYNADVRDVEIAVTVADGTILHMLMPGYDEPEVFPFHWMNELDFGADWVKTGAEIPTTWTGETIPAEVWSTATPLPAGTYVFKDIPIDPDLGDYGSFYGIAATQAVLHDEAVDGDLRSSFNFEFDVGPNRLIGTVSGITPEDSDSFRFQVPAGTVLQSITWDLQFNGPLTGMSWNVNTEPEQNIPLSFGFIPSDTGSPFDLAIDVLPLPAGNYRFGTGTGFNGTADYILTFNVEEENPDSDGDGVLDASDNCPNLANSDQADNDGDLAGDVCDNDDDNDGVVDTADNCPTTLGGNADQTDADMDGAGDICDNDLDGDGVDNASDNCPADPNAGQEDNDGDLSGDACDSDDDNDGVLDATDNCPFTDNPAQADQDGDNIGDACDADVDGDSVDNGVDNCPLDSNAGQDDVDGDLMGDVCDADDDNDGVLDGDDNCRATPNPDQTNTDGTGGGDACDEDDDDDGVLDGGDNCPFVSNAAQSDFDNDGSGDACDDDLDNDGVANDSDICGFTPQGAVIDPALGCSIAELCPCEGPRGTTNDWRNHGKYVSCVAKTSKSFVKQGLISSTDRSDIVSAAGESGCGK